MTGKRLITSLLLLSLVSMSLPLPANAQNYTWTKLYEAKFEGGNFNEFSATSIYNGTLNVITDSTRAYEGSRFAEATLSGTGDNGYSRGQWTLNLSDNAVYRTEAAFFLPSGFYNSMRGSIQLIGWDPYPILNNHMRLIIYNSDKKARLFIKNDGVDTELTNSFSIPENQWVKLAIEQKVSNSDGWSKVYMNDNLVAQGTGDNANYFPITRIRYGFVANAGSVQNVPMTLYFDDVSFYTGTLTTSTPSPTPTAKTGDANGDNLVDGKDYVVWLNNYNTNTTEGASKGDFNNDGFVDGKDYVGWLNNYGK